MDAAQPSQTTRGLSTQHLFLLLPWIGIVLAARQPIRDNSFLWHVEAGRLQVDAGQVLRSDPFSFTRFDEAWRTQSWVLDVLYATLQRVSDLGWVPWFIGVIAGLTLLIVGVHTHRASGSLLATGLVGVAVVWIGVPFFSPRPVLVSYLFLALTAYVVSDMRHRWALPLIIWIWAAAHGSFVLGLGLIVLDGLRRRDRRRVVDAAVSTLAATATAHGVAIWGILAAFGANREALDLIQEWRPPDIFEPFFLPYALAVVGVAVGSANGSIRRRDLWIVLPFLLFGFTASRAIFPAFIVLAPWLAVALRDVLPELRPTPATGPLLIGNLVLVVAIVALPFMLEGGENRLSETRFPLEAATALEAVPTFHDDVVGGYLIYARSLPNGVFADDRAELFGAEILGAIVDVRNGHPSWRTTFDEFAIEQAIVATESGIAEVLRASGWAVVFEDEDFSVLRAS